MRLTPRLVLPRPPPLSTSTTEARDDIQAGTSPDTTAATIVAATVHASTRPSTSNVIHDGGGFSRLCSVDDSQSIDKYASADADGRADCREQQALREHLPDQPHARGAERGSDRELPRPQRGARELHVHHVDARDEQHAHAKARASSAACRAAGAA